jgi:hypothetical protein
MKKYHDMAKESAKEKLSHYGKVDEENAPMGIRPRGAMIERMVPKACGGKVRARGGKVMPGMHGEKAGARLDRYASGGAVGKGKGKTIVNINVGQPQPAMPQRVPVPVPIPAGGPPPGAMARPPMPMPPPGAIPPGAGAMPPPGMMPPPGAMPPPGMMRKRGGRVMKRADGGDVSTRRERNDPRPGNPDDAMEDLKDKGQSISDYNQASDPDSNDTKNSPWGGGRGPTPQNLRNANYNVKQGGSFYGGLGNKRGGVVDRKKHAAGGRVMTDGAGSGPGRLEKIGRRAKPADKDGVVNGI